MHFVPRQEKPRFSSVPILQIRNLILKRWNANLNATSMDILRMPLTARGIISATSPFLSYERVICNVLWVIISMELDAKRELARLIKL